MAYQAKACPGCGFENHPSCRFCIGCGAGIEAVEVSVLDPDPMPEGDPEGAGAAPREEVRALVARLVEGSGFPAEGSDRGWKVTVPVPGDRTQTVHVLYGGQDEDGDEVVRFLTVCAPYDARHAGALLELNASLPHCAVAVVKVKGRDAYGVVAHQLAATADEAEITKRLVQVATRGDSIEAKLRGGKDSF